MYGAWRVRVRTKSSRRSCLGQLLTQMVPSLQLSDLASAPALWLVLVASSPHSPALQPVKALVGLALEHCMNWGRDSSPFTVPQHYFIHPKPESQEIEHILPFQSCPRARLHHFMAQFLAHLHFIFLISAAVCFQAFGMPNDFQSTVYFNPSNLLIHRLASKCLGKESKEVVPSALNKASNCHMITSKQQQAAHFVGYIMIQPHGASSSVSGFLTHVTPQHNRAHQLQK